MKTPDERQFEDAFAEFVGEHLTGADLDQVNDRAWALAKEWAWQVWSAVERDNAEHERRAGSA